jgi:sialic acid synthase SpsE
MEVSNMWLKDVAAYCLERDIEFMCTPFDEDAVDFLYELGVKRIKVSGFESTDIRFIKYVASTKLPIVVSAGLGCGIKFIGNIINTCRSVGCNDITILHCNSAYPTPQSDIRLEAIKLIKDEYDIKVGLSDHTLSTITPSLAVMYGAECIEKHFTLSRSMKGPDHFFAIEPDELKEMVEYIKIAEMSKGIKDTFTDSEINNSFQGRRSIVLKKDVTAGERITSENITTKRPYYEGNIPASDFYSISDGTMSFDRNLSRDQFLKIEHILKEKK